MTTSTDKVYRIVNSAGAFFGRFYTERGPAQRVCTKWNNQDWHTDGPYEVEEGVITWQT